MYMFKLPSAVFGLTLLCLGRVNAEGRVKTSVVVDRPATDGGTRLVVSIAHATGVHTWSNVPQRIPGLTGFRPYETRADVVDLEATAAAAPAVWPLPTKLRVNLGGHPVEIMGLTGLVRATIPLIGVRGPVHGRIAISYQPCDAQVCYPPHTDTLSFSER